MLFRRARSIEMRPPSASIRITRPPHVLSSNLPAPQASFHGELGTVKHSVEIEEPSSSPRVHSTAGAEAMLPEGIGCFVAEGIQ
jgi:hypothetical protein